MKHFIVFCFILFSISCKSKKSPKTANTNEIKKVINKIEIDSLEKLLDFEDSSLVFLDTLRNEDLLAIQGDITFNKYRQYRLAIPMLVDSNLNIPFAEMHDQEFLNFMTENNSYSDSLINTIPDPLASKRILLMDRLLKSAQFMFDINNSGHNDTVDGNLVRSGIKYAWGSKEINIKYNPFERTKELDQPSICNYSITGLDCSGFIYQLFKQNRIGFPEGNANLQRQSFTIKSALDSYFNFSKRFVVQDYQTIQPTKIEPGDILYFYEVEDKGKIQATHIGMALTSPEGIKLFHSSGGRNRCDYNKSVQGGIRCVNITKYLAGRNYGVVRIKIDPT